MLKLEEGSVADGTERVADWIDPVTRAWREEVVRRAVDPIDAEAVLKVQIPLDHKSDVYRWPNTTDRRISVRSAYHSIKNRQVMRAPEEDTASVAEISNLWLAIWKARVLPKVQTFMWRLATNPIAVRANLVRRGIQTSSSLCHACDEPESIEHLILDCSWVQPIWQGMLGLNMAGLQ